MNITKEAIDAILPQTQCTQCGYKDCMDYANAISQGTPHNQCPPGGKEGIIKLSKLLNRDILPLNPENGTEGPRLVTQVNEDLCIGCTKCIQACPVDAIVGANRLMHTIIEAECTGCELCIEPCPMDCIDLVELPENKQPMNLSEAEKTKQQNHYRNRHNARIKRLNQEEKYQRQRHHQNKEAITTKKETPTDTKKQKQDYIKQALAEFRAKKKNRS
ncbi:RnfABCDGE type electron transport complex subunit B [Thiotrichales bacterium 19S9-12]|nr:RnfABCDGE type electron transport complex subunit B [Thiotrichales bacterium 19S9-11]MCF6811308.1 RnfABCDGE type electron transport complex subunit B [Thiotrichales bacterium 19S9-12]